MRKVAPVQSITDIEVVTRRFEVVTRGFKVVTRGFKLVTRGFELVIRRLDSKSTSYEIKSMS